MTPQRLYGVALEFDSPARLVEAARAVRDESVNWMIVVVPVGLGGVWVAAFLRQLRRWPLLPLGAPNLGSAIAAAK